MRNGVELIAVERARQVTQEGWVAEHDDTHVGGDLAQAGALYAQHAGSGGPGRWLTAHGLHMAPYGWPWDEKWWKPSENGDAVRDLVKAGALIAAEIDRVQRRDERERSSEGSNG